MTTKVVSIAVFGEGDKYAQYLPSFVIAHLNLFPISEGWALRVHTDRIVDENKYGLLLRRLVSQGLIKLESMGPAILTKAMLWRMAPVFDAEVDYVFCRDLDACPMPRDRAICNQFIVSEAMISAPHDNMAHAGIMGGMCGFWADPFRKTMSWNSLDDLYAAAGKSDSEWAQHGTDQNVLNRLVSNNPNITLLEHRFNGWTEGHPTCYRRSAGAYGCQAWSAPTPDIGVSKLTGELAKQADRLANHMGAAGYDHLTARKFWEEHGDPEIAAQIAACERL